MLYDDAVYECVALLDPIVNPDGTLRCPKLRKGSADELESSESALSIVRSLSSPCYGLAVARFVKMIFLIIPADRLNLTRTRDVSASYLPATRRAGAAVPSRNTLSTYEYVYQ